MPYADTTTIILGADGFVGRHLLRFWRERGWKVHAIGRSAGDLTDPATADGALHRAPAAGRIFHVVTRQRTGAIQYGLQAELLTTNALIHLNVLQAWHRHQPSAKLISLGSSCVYPESQNALREAAFRTGAPHPSVRGYAFAKELLITGSELFAQQYGLTWLHCVMATLYGPGAHTEPHRSHFMAALLDRAVRGQAQGRDVFEVWGNPLAVRDLLYIDDQIEAIIAADAAFENRILNVSANAPVTIRSCTEAILAALAWRAEVGHPPDSFRGTDYKALDSSDFLATSGWMPKIPLETGIARVLRADYPELFSQ